MTETVTDIIVARSRPSEGLQTMVVWSTFGHIALIALLLFSGTRIVDERQEPVMTISLGGAPGPQTGGLTQIGARAVQAPAPPDAPPRQAITPPAPTPPKMALPDPAVKPRPQPRPQRAPPEANARRENTGPQPTDGNARAETPVVRGQGFGLSSAGGSGGPVQVDAANFCCPDYLAQLVTVIQRTWDNNQGVVGSTTVRFTIARDGSILTPQVEIPSGFIALDSSALRAVQVTRAPPLPAAFQNPTLTVHMRFDYQR
ncbi:MAG TPA: energy transducer TonB [Vicinamibacterales bacterium]|nr:energy transducer TonB [Vicinamibacterales bacterium]